MAEPHRKRPADLGKNRTGVQTAPVQTPRMLENTDAVPAAPLDAMALGLARAELSAQAPPVGTMPVPGNLKGVAKAVLKALQGEKATVFLDKLGERLQFERTGVRLYEAVMAKLPASHTGQGTLDAADLRGFHDEELAHFLLVKEAIESMGGDPTAITPCADVATVQAAGLVKVVTDPRTTLTQCLSALLTAELADNDGWQTLIAMAEALDQQDLALRFGEALSAEDRHLRSVRAWIHERLGIELGAALPSPEPGPPPTAG